MMGGVARGVEKSGSKSLLLKPYVVLRTPGSMTAQTFVAYEPFTSIFTPAYACAVDDLDFT